MQNLMKELQKKLSDENRFRRIILLYTVQVLRTI